MLENHHPLYALCDALSGRQDIASIGISSSLVFPEPGASDVDVFIYCDAVPPAEERKAAVERTVGLEESAIDFFSGERWGIGDRLVVRGVEIWLMYFTCEQVLEDIRSVLNGERPLKEGADYFPTGRMAAILKMNAVWDERGFLDGLKQRLSEYPTTLGESILGQCVARLDNTEDLDRAALRADVLHYHGALDAALEYYLQALFALNRSFFTGRKRNIAAIEGFERKPENCAQRILEAVKLGGGAETIGASYCIWKALVADLKCP